MGGSHHRVDEHDWFRLPPMAARVCTGLVYQNCAEKPPSVYSSKAEPIVLPLEDGTGCLSASCSEHIAELMTDMDVVA